MLQPLGLLVLLGLGAVLLWAVVVWMTARQLTRPPRRGEGWAIARSLPVDPGEAGAAMGRAMEWERWPLTLRGGACTVEVWDIKGHRAGGPVVIFTPGWGESRVSSLSRLGVWLEGASRVVLWEVPGHGDSPAPSRCGLGAVEVADLAALAEIVVGPPGQRDRRGQPGAGPGPGPGRRPALVLHGYSMGAGVSIAAAAGLAARGVAVAMVIAEAPYRLPATPAAAVMRLRGSPWRATVTPALWLAGVRVGAPAGWLRAGGPFDRAGQARAAAALGVRLLVIHGACDEVCPPRDGREIADAANGAAPGAAEYVELPATGHTDGWPGAGPAVARALAAL